jgi:hypothetical protein
VALVAYVPLPPEKVPRGGALRSIIIFLSIASVVGSVGGLISVVVSPEEDNTLGPSPLPRRVMMLALCGLLNAGFMAGIWGWRRWGVYGIVCVSLFAFMLNWRIAGPMVAAPGLIGPALLATVAGLSWGEFD